MGSLNRRVESVVVVGGGLGGHRVVHALRSSGHTGSITLVGDESVLPYDRPPLSKQVLANGTPAPHLGTFEEYAELGADLRLGSPATGLNTTQSRVMLADGCSLGYDALVIATGSKARTLPFLEAAGALTLRTDQDALNLRSRLTAGRRLVVVGGGFIGCEVAASARALGVDVTIVEALPTLLARALGPAMGEIVRGLHEDNGVAMRCGMGVHDARAEGSEIVLVLSDGGELRADTVVVGIGGSPALAWIGDAAIKIDDGVVCDAGGRTTVPGIYAVGDVARWESRRLGLAAPRCEHWTATVEQAAVVAHNITSADGREHHEVAYVWSDQFGLKLQAIGWPDPNDAVEIVRWGARARPVALYHRGEEITGAVGISAAPAIARLRGALSSGSVTRSDALALLN